MGTATTCAPWTLKTRSPARSVAMARSPVGVAMGVSGDAHSQNAEHKPSAPQAQQAFPCGPPGGSQPPEGLTMHVPGGHWLLPPLELETPDELDELCTLEAAPPLPAPPTPGVPAGSKTTLPPQAPRPRTTTPIPTSKRLRTREVLSRMGAIKRPVTGPRSPASWPQPAR